MTNSYINHQIIRVGIEKFMEEEGLSMDYVDKIFDYILKAQDDIKIHKHQEDY